jgi:hypothetical protein
MANRWTIGVAAACAVALNACGNLDLNSYLVEANDKEGAVGRPLAAAPPALGSSNCTAAAGLFDQALTDFSTRSLTADLASPSAQAAAMVQLKAQLMTEVDRRPNQLETYRARIPSSLRDTPAVNAVFAAAKRSAAFGVQAKHKALVENYGTMTRGRANAQVLAAFRQSVAENDQTVQTRYPQAPSLSVKDFRNLQYEISEQVFRHTRGTPSGTGPRALDTAATDDAFWDHLGTYYSKYFAGSFVDYFGVAYPAPTLSLTLSDTDLGYAIAVFFELVFDEGAQTPLWKVQPDSSHKGTITADSSSNASTSTFLMVAANAKTLGWQQGMSIVDSDHAPPAGTNPTIQDVVPLPSGSTKVVVKPPITGNVGGLVNLKVSPTSDIYYPGGPTAKPTTPTRIDALNMPAEAISMNPTDPDCVMNINKATAINTLSQMFASGGSNAAGTLVGTMGGFGISFGMFGKLSIGDNKAVTTIIQSTVSQLIRRSTVEISYEVLRAIPLSPETTPYQMTGYFVSPNLKSGTPRDPWYAIQ